MLELIFQMADKEKKMTPLRGLREAAGLSQRELAKRIGVHHTNVQYWENTGAIPRADLVQSIADVLSCSPEQLLGQTPKRKTAQGSKMKQLFEAAMKLPRRQQDKIVAILEPFIKEHSNDKAS